MRTENPVQPGKLCIFTFGYGNRKTYDALETYLTDYEIKWVVDLRKSPRAWSQKWYGKQLQKLCESLKIGYVSKTSLGNISGKANWIPPNAEAAEEALAEVAEMAREGSILLLCAEMDANRCHRKEVADRLTELVSIPVEHLR
jgi:uncharacterized protein (DUF488 family)